MSTLSVPPNKRLVLLAGRSHPELGVEVANQLGIDLCPISAYDFANGEIFVRFEESVRGCDAFVLQSQANAPRISSPSAVEHGVTEEEIRTLLDPSLELDFLNVAEQAAIRFADAVASLSPVMPIQTELHNELASHFSDCELVELFTIVGVLTGMGRMLAASGFIPATCDISGVMPDSTFDK